MPCLFKQCRSRSVGFWRSQLIWINTVCHSVCEFVSKPESTNWLAECIKCGRGILIYSAWQRATVFYNRTFFFPTHENAGQRRFLIYLKIIFHEIVRQTTNVWYSYLTCKENWWIMIRLCSWWLKTSISSRHPQFALPNESKCPKNYDTQPKSRNKNLLHTLFL